MTQPRVRLLRTVLFALLLLLLVPACAPIPNNAGNANTGANNAAQEQATVTPFPTAPAAARTTATVERGTVTLDYTFNARWLPRDQYLLSFQIDGTVRNVNARRNDTVTAGDLLADYQIEALEDQLTQQELDLETALYRLQTGEEGNADPIVSAQFQLANSQIQLDIERNSIDWTGVANAKLQLDNAQRSLDQARRDYDDVVSRQESTGGQIEGALQRVKDAENALQQAQNGYFSASQSYNNNVERLKLQENTVLQNELALEQAQSGTGGNFEDLQAVRAAENNVNQTREEILNSTLVSPIDGVILSVDISSGDAVQAFVPVITVAIPDPKEAVGEGLAFNDIQQLSVGDVGVCSITNPELSVQCVIRSLPLSSSDADQTVRVAATLPEATLGQAVEVVMPLETREDVLFLPPGYIRTFQDREFVIILTDEGEQIRDVVVGLRTDEREEIVSGLEEGDVVLAP
jgi:multidrug efflux pump subunit AcrA (membrane-fusion protein)